MGLDGRFVALRKESVDRNTMRRDFKALGLLSLSARRAWIEINRGRGRGRRHCVALRKESVDRNRDSRNSQNINRGSLSARRAWIEISTGPSLASFDNKSLSARRAWIEIVKLFRQNYECLSLSARRAWIEIWYHLLGLQSCPQVALRKESVDRNMMWMSYHLIGFRSLSARRAWIEIARRSWKRISDLSLSARRAWIEIFLRATSDGKIEVALRKESVDRNQQNVGQNYIAGDGRSPQGERG